MQGWVQAMTLARVVILRAQPHGCQCLPLCYTRLAGAEPAAHLFRLQATDLSRASAVHTSAGQRAERLSLWGLTWSGANGGVAFDWFHRLWSECLCTRSICKAA